MGVIAAAALITATCACGKSVARGEATVTSPSGTPPTNSATPAASATPTAAPPSAVAPLPKPPSATPLAERVEQLKKPGDPAAKMVPYLAGTPVRAALDASQWAACSTAARAWLDANSKHPHRREATLIAALCDEHQGQGAVAAKAYEALASSDPVLKDVLWLRAAESWLAAGYANKCLAALDKLPSSGFARVHRAAEIRARAHSQNGDTSKALAAFATAASASRASLSLILDTAKTAHSAKSPDEAKWWRQALVRHPGSSSEPITQLKLRGIGGPESSLTDSELLERAQTARSRHKRKLAIDVANELLKKTKAGERMWCDAGLVKARALETAWPSRKEAAALYDKLARTCPHKPWTLKLRYRGAKRQMGSGSGKRALELFDEIAAIEPTSSLVDDAMRYQARILAEQGRAKAANAKLEAILALKGDMVEYAGWDLLLKEIVAKKWKRCVAVGKRVIAASPTTAKRYNNGRAAYWTGLCELRARRKKAAIARWKRVASDYPTSWYGVLATLRLRALKQAPLRPKQATAGLAKDLFATNPRLLADRHFLAGVELLRLGMTTSAAAELSAVPWDKKNDGERMLRAQLYAAVGDYTRATAIASHSREFDGLGKRPSDDRSSWELAYPRPPEFRPLVKKETDERGVDPMFVWAIMRSESRFNRRATSPVLATGLLQLMPATAKTVAKRINDSTAITREKLMDPPLNIRLGTAYMRRLHDRNGGHYPLVASGYNAGPHNTSQWQVRFAGAELDEFVERIPFRENRRYVKSVVTSWIRYTALYGDGALPALEFKVTKAKKRRSPSRPRRSRRTKR